MDFKVGDLLKCNNPNLVDIFLMDENKPIRVLEVSDSRSIRILYFDTIPSKNEWTIDKDTTLYKSLVPFNDKPKAKTKFSYKAFKKLLEDL